MITQPGTTLDIGFESTPVKFSAYLPSAGLLHLIAVVPPRSLASMSFPKLRRWTGQVIGVHRRYPPANIISRRFTPINADSK